jgi:RNA-directed DNA polymerase
MWLQAPVEERDENGRRRLTGGKDRHCGTPQGGVASPILANLYMNRLLKGWRKTKRGKQFDAHIVNYADDFVILSRGKAVEALEWTRQVVTRMGVTLNEAKTSIKEARKESFNFLGYTFGPHRYRENGRWYLGASPSKKAVARIKEKVGSLLIPGNTGTWEEVRGRLNQILRGWSAYFSYGTRAAAYGAVDNYVYESVRHFLRRRHQVQSRGTSCFSKEAVFGELGVLQLRRVQVNSRS